MVIELPRVWAGQVLRARVDLHTFTGNLTALREASAPQSLGLVVKANAYGHGAVPVARAANDSGISDLYVATVGEALELRHHGIPGRVTLFLFESAAEVREASEAGVAVVCGSLDQLEQVVSAGARGPVLVVLEVDSGMARNGVPTSEVSALGAAACRGQRAGRIHVVEVMSHLARADEPESTTTMEQTHLFLAALESLSEVGLRDVATSLANSAGVMFHSFDPAITSARVGLAAYGITPAGTELPYVRPVMTLEAPVLSVKAIPAGTGVSYGHTWIAPQDTLIAVVGGGYADGVPRVNGLSVGIGGRACPVRGTVNMDQFMVEVSPGTRRGDVAVIIGTDGEFRQTVASIATIAGRSPYEVLTAIGGRTRLTYV